MKKLQRERTATRSNQQDVAQPGDDLTEDELRESIATAAYYRAQERGFEPGQELDDWLAAETEIKSKRVAPMEV